jgi:TonB family protein
MTDLDLQAMLVPIYAERFTTEELRQILEFESSPVGQKLRSSEATMLAEIQPQMVAWSRSTGQEVTRQILTEHPEWANEIAERRQKQNAQALATMPAGDERANEAIHWNTRDVQPPQIISKSEPQYSEDGLKAKTEGSVGLSITVGVDGAARDIKVVRPLGQGLDEKAIEAVRTWHWKPAMKGGVAIATRATVEVNFRLLNTPPPQK